MCWDLNPAKTQFGTQIHVAGTQTQLEPCLGLETHMSGTQIQPKPCLGFKPSQNSRYLVSGPNEAQVLDVS